MRVSNAIQAEADREILAHPNHVVGSGRLWHWSYYHSGYGMAQGWAASQRAARDARHRAMGEMGDSV